MDLLKRFSSYLFSDSKKDEIDGCVQLIFKGQETEHSVLIYSQVRDKFFLELKARKKRNSEENDIINNFLNQ